MINNNVYLLSEPPPVPPEITGVPPGGLTSGEWLRVSCHLPWMNVKPSLEFWVNDRRARHMVSTIHCSGIDFITAVFYMANAMA